MSAPCDHDGEPCTEPTCGGHWQCGCPLDRFDRGHVQVVALGESFVSVVTHPCGHAYRSQVRWNTEQQALAHGSGLLDKVCSTCRRSGRA